MTIQTLIKGMLPVCQKCREVNGEEPDKCGKREWCKSIFAAGIKHGATHEREDCAAIANRKMVAATEAEPMAEQASEAIRAGHFAIAAGQIEDAIRARGKA